LLDTITGVFGRSTKTSKKVQDEIVKKIEEQEDVLKITEETPSDETTEKVEEIKQTERKAKPSAPVNKAASTVKPATDAPTQRRIKPQI